MQLLTATGARPEAWALCEQWMARQDYAGPVHWVIVDDGETPQPITFSRDGWTLTVIRPLPRWKQGMNTQCRNMLAGLEKIDRTQPLLMCASPKDRASPAFDRIRPKIYADGLTTTDALV